MAQALTLRRLESALRHDRWFDQAPQGATDLALSWVTPQGQAMHWAHWEDLNHSAFACHIRTAAAMAHTRGHRGSEQLLLAFNPQAEPTAFTLPATRTRAGSSNASWRVALDSSGTWPRDAAVAGVCSVPAHSLVVLAF